MANVIDVSTESTAQAILEELKKISAQLDVLRARNKSDGMTTINITNIQPTGQEVDNDNSIY